MQMLLIEKSTRMNKEKQDTHIEIGSTKNNNDSDVLYVYKIMENMFNRQCDQSKLQTFRIWILVEKLRTVIALLVFTLIFV